MRFPCSVLVPVSWDLSRQRSESNRPSLGRDYPLAGRETLKNFDVAVISDSKRELPFLERLAGKLDVDDVFAVFINESRFRNGQRVSWRGDFYEDVDRHADAKATLPILHFVDQGDGVCLYVDLKP